MTKKFTFLALLLTLIAGTRIFAGGINPEVIAGAAGAGTGILLNLTNGTTVTKKYLVKPANALGIDLLDCALTSGLLVGLGVNKYLNGGNDNCKAIQHLLIGAGTFHVLKSETAKKILNSLPLINRLVCNESGCEGICQKCAATKYGASALAIYAGNRLLDQLKARHNSTEN